MIDRQHRFLGWLDGLVVWTGVPSMIAGTQRKRHLRWPPLLALVLASAGLLWCLVHPGRSYWLGYALIMFGLLIANLMPIWGPLRRFGERADEFERQQRRDSLLVGLAAVAAASFAGMWITVALLALRVWTAQTAQQELAAIAFFMMALFGAVPTMHASWRTLPPPDEN